MPTKILWMRRQRVLRRLLKKYREGKKISKDIYHYFYLHAKGNIYKNKSVLVEAIHKMKQEKIRENQLAEQQEARRVKAAAKKQQRNHRKQVTMGIIAEEEKANWARDSLLTANKANPLNSNKWCTLIAQIWLGMNLLNNYEPLV